MSQDALEALKKELRPLIKKANQRLYRLEQAQLTSSHGYTAAQRVTGRSEKPRFGIVNKSLQELQDERQRVDNFLEYQSSTVTGTRELLQRYAEQMRVPYARDTEQLVDNSSRFFRLSNRVKQYIRNTSQSRHISSDEIFMGISRAVNNGEIDLQTLDFENFDLTEYQMEAILEGSGATTRTTSVFDDLDAMDEVGYDTAIRFDEYDPNDF